MLRTHLPDELLDGLVDGIGPKVELAGHAPCLLCQRHAACRVSVDLLVEGAGGFWTMRGPRADWRGLVQRVAGGVGDCGVCLMIPIALGGSEAEELVRKPRG